MTYVAEVLADAPHAYWKLDETSGTVATDSSGNGHDGTYVGGVALAVESTAIGHAVSFDGVNDTVVTAVTADTWRFEQWTLECWVKFATIPGSDEAHPLMTTSYGGGGNPVPMALGVDLSAPGMGGVLEGGFYQQAVGGWFTAKDPSSVATAAWIHAVATFDGTILRLYLAGLQVSAYTPWYPGEPFAVSPPDFRLAQRWDSGGASNFVAVRMQHAAVYPSALSAGRIGAHYVLGTGGTLTDLAVTADGVGDADLGATVLFYGPTVNLDVAPDGRSDVLWGIAVDGVSNVVFSPDGRSDVSFVLGGGLHELSFDFGGSSDVAFSLAGPIALSFEADGIGEALFAAVSDPGTGSGGSGPGPIPQAAPGGDNLPVELTLSFTGSFEVRGPTGGSA